MVVLPSPTSPRSATKPWRASMPSQGGLMAGAQEEEFWIGRDVKRRFFQTVKIEIHGSTFPACGPSGAPVVMGQAQAAVEAPTAPRQRCMTAQQPALRHGVRRQVQRETLRIKTGSYW